MKFIVLSTTSKHDTDILKLPDKSIFDDLNSNFLVSNLKNLKKIIERYNQKDTYFLLDTEKKQGISLYDEANVSNKIDYKPNDLTMEAADLTLLNYFDKNISGKSVAIYGTGNIAFKLALRLSERNANVFLYGRNKNKLNICVEALRQITFDGNLIHYGNEKAKVDSLVSFVSGDEIIDIKYLGILKQKSLCLDGGIGNFTKEFIRLSLEKEHEVRRLDVRQSQEIMDGYINSRINSEFDKVIGRDIINNQSIVAGGIMGRYGEIVVDSITEPSKVIGIANGIGGVKNESELNSEEHIKIEEVQSYIEQNL